MRKPLTVIAAVAALTACGSGEEERPGSPEVYQQIESSEDCAGLQETFDRAYTNNERAEPGTDAHKWTLGYMQAADERMRELDCY